MFEVVLIIGVAAKKAENHIVATHVAQIILPTSGYGWC